MAMSALAQRTFLIAPLVSAREEKQTYDHLPMCQFALRANVNVNRALALLRPWCISSKHISEVRKMSALSPETLKLLQSVLDDAWESLTAEERARTTKSLVASRILEVAAAGELDPVRLRAAAKLGTQEAVI
jgi:hypothetical protein